MIEPSTKSISRLQVIRDRAVAREMAKATEQEIDPGIEDGAEKATEPRGEKGSLEGEARALLKRMIARGLRPTEAQRRQIMACTDPAQVALWSERAASAGSVSAVLARRPAGARSGRG